MYLVIVIDVKLYFDFQLSSPRVFFSVPNHHDVKQHGRRVNYAGLRQGIPNGHAHVGFSNCASTTLNKFRQRSSSAGMSAVGDRKHSTPADCASWVVDNARETVQSAGRLVISESLQVSHKCK